MNAETYSALLDPKYKPKEEEPAKENPVLPSPGKPFTDLEVANQRHLIDSLQSLNVLESVILKRISELESITLNSTLVVDHHTLIKYLTEIATLRKVHKLLTHGFYPNTL